MVVETEVGSPGADTRANGNAVGSPTLAGKFAHPHGRFDALVTQGWGRVAYNIVRSLARKKLRVVLGTDEFLGMAMLSRYTAATFRHPSFVRQPLDFVATLRASLETYGPRVYLPADEEVLVVAKWLDQLGKPETKIPIASFGALRALHKKDALMRLAASLEIPTPENMVPRNFEEVLDFSKEYGDPVVIKRLNSSSSRGVSYVTRAALLAGYGNSHSKALPYGEFLVQRYVRGTGYGVSMLFNHGELRAKFTHKRLRDRTPTGGVSTVRMSVENALLEEYAERLLRHLDFHGVAMVEFRYDEASKQAFLLEVNPRFWGSLALAIHAGVDFPYLLYRMAIDDDVEPVLDYRKNVTVRWILGDALATIRRLGHNGTPAAAPWGHFTAEAFDDLDWTDPLPLVGEILFSARKYLKTRRSIANQIDLSRERL
jgi:predicted ATP-grasp superfamily ATP-dependent carboligase